MNLGASAITTLKLGSQQVSRVMLGSVEVWANMDADVAAYVAASGATDTTGIEDLAAYLKAQSLWNNARIYPMKSAQNAGSGTTLYGLGGLTSNNGTLVNSPTWGAGGIAFAHASAQFVRIADFFDASDLTMFTRANITGIGGSDGVIAGQRKSSTEERSVWFSTNSNNWSVVNRTSSGNASSGLEVYRNTDNILGAERCFVSQWVDGGGRNLWWDKTSKSISRVSGSDQTAHANVGSDITIMAGLSGSSPVFPTSGTVVAQMFLQGVLPSTAQQEAITDYINAL
jgi:hypothetical protein